MKMTMKKWLSLLLSLALCLALLPSATFADPGQEPDSAQSEQEEDSGLTLTGWHDDIPGSEGQWFYFDPDTGEMRTGLTRIEGKWYYLGTDGARQTGWVQLEDSWYCFGEDGAMLTDTVADGYQLGADGKRGLQVNSNGGSQSKAGEQGSAKAGGVTNTEQVPNPELKISLTSSAGCMPIVLDSVIEYTLFVENTGNTTLIDVVVIFCRQADYPYDYTHTIPLLDPGETWHDDHCILVREDDVRNGKLEVIFNAKADPVTDADTGITYNPEMTLKHESLLYTDLDLALKGSYPGKFFVDGIELSPEISDGWSCFNFPAGAKIFTYCEYNNGSDPHSTYPVSMKVWLLSYDAQSDKWTATAFSELDNLLSYCGTSIRTTGARGVRSVTGIDEALKTRLIAGLNGYTLIEYGTVMAWTDKLNGADLTLDNHNAVSNYAYSKANNKDPVFNRSGGKLQYTNVLMLSDLPDSELNRDITMRPYMKLMDSTGSELVIYGGEIERSVGYVAYQNRDAYKPKTSAYKYIWKIIRAAYGDKYDSEYSGK